MICLYSDSTRVDNIICRILLFKFYTFHSLSMLSGNAHLWHWRMFWFAHRQRWKNFIDLDSVKPNPTYLFPAENSQPHGLSHLLDLEQLHISFVPGTKSLLNLAYSTYNVNCVAIDLKGKKYHRNNPFLKSGLPHVSFLRF